MSDTIPDFASQAEEDVTRLRSAIAHVIESIPDFSYRRPSELADKLRLDQKLAWNIGRCVDTADPFESARFIPGPAGAKTFLRAARACEVADERVLAARQAFDSFFELVSVHAGTRKCFNAIAAGLTSTGRSQTGIENRRLTFEGNRYIWGVQARTAFRAHIAHPSADGCTWDLATLRGAVDFQLMRPNVTWRFARTASMDLSSARTIGTRRAALDPASGDGVPLLTEFCTKPLPKFRSMTGPSGEEEFALVPGSVGNTARLTCITGESILNIEPRYRTEQYPDFRLLYHVRMPAEVLVYDAYIHRSLFTDGIPLESDLYSDLFGLPPDLRWQDCDRLPLDEQIVRLPGDPAAAQTTDIPHYASLFEYVFDRAGWDPREFHLYRLRIQYPPIPATLGYSRPLPPPPEGYGV